RRRRSLPLSRDAHERRVCFFFYCFRVQRDLHSFPTRRSSDLLTTYIPKTSAFTLAFSTSQRLRTTRASARTLRGTKGKRKGARLDRKSGSAGMPRPISYAVCCLKKKKKKATIRYGRESAKPTG